MEEVLKIFFGDKSKFEPLSTNGCLSLSSKTSPFLDVCTTRKRARHSSPEKNYIIGNRGNVINEKISRLEFDLGALASFSKTRISLHSYKELKNLHDEDISSKNTLDDMNMVENTKNVNGENIVLSSCLELKRKPDTSDQQLKSKIINEENDFVDVLHDMGVKDGLRIEVQWDIQEDLDKNNDILDSKAPDVDIHTESKVDNIQCTQKSKTSWRGAIILPHDGRIYILDDKDDQQTYSTTLSTSIDFVKVPLRCIYYDSLPESGFNEKYIEEVCFLSNHSIFNISRNSSSSWRIEGDVLYPLLDDNTKLGCINMITTDSHYNDPLIIPSGPRRETALRNVLDNILLSVLESKRFSKKMKSLTAYQKCYMTRKISRAKDALLLKILKYFDKILECENMGSSRQNSSFEVTPDHIKRCMDEVKKELNL